MTGPHSRPPLPQRRPQEHIAPQLLDGDDSYDGSTHLPQTGDAADFERSARDAHDMMAAFQRASRAAREAGEPSDL